MFVTIGSDFHVEDENNPEIGLENVGVLLEDQVINEIIDNIKK